MAREYAKLSTSIWASKKFASLKGDRARLLYFYLHTCPQVTSCGCFRIPVKYCVADLGWGASQVAEAIDSLCEALLIAWNASEEIVRIVGFLDHDPPTNPKHAGAIARTALTLPDCREKVAVLHDLLKSKHSSEIQELREIYHRLCEVYQDGMPEPRQTPLPLSVTPIPVPSSLRSDDARKRARTSIADVWPTEKGRENAVVYWRKHGREDLIGFLDREAEKARAHHMAKGTRSPDWEAVWTTWYVNSVSFNRPGAQASSYPTATIHKVA